MKTCSKCDKAKPFEAFPRTKTGHKGQCQACRNSAARERYRTDEARREKQKANSARYSGKGDPAARHAFLDRTREDRRRRKAEYRRKAGVLSLEQKRSAAAARKAEIEAARVERAYKLPHAAHVSAWKRAKPGAHFAHQYRNNAEFNAKQKLRAQLRKLRFKDHDLQRLMALNLKAGRFAKGWKELLGYTAEELVDHLKRTLPKRCKWEQFLSGELHIDHITPRAAFDLTDLDEVRACWSLGNLRLLPAAVNLAKAARIDVLL